jgi:hypothetical protein
LIESPPSLGILIPSYVFLQARQQYSLANSDFGWKEEFALQVIQQET